MPDEPERDLKVKCMENFCYFSHLRTAHISPAPPFLSSAHESCLLLNHIIQFIETTNST